jgi:hypothetical protein
LYVTGLEGRVQQEEGPTVDPAKVQSGTKGSGSEAGLQPRRRKILNPQKRTIVPIPLQAAPPGAHPEVPIPGDSESVQQLARTGEERR